MTGNTSEPNDPLLALLAQHGLAAHHDGLLKQQVDLEVLATLTDEDASALATLLQMPFGPAKKFRVMCEALRAARAANADAVGGGSTTTTPTSAGTTSAATLPPLDPPLEQDLLDHLPTPIARAARCISVAVDPVHFADALETVADTLLRFMALVCKADYLSAANWHDATLNSRFKKLERPALGDWWNFINDSITGAERVGHPLFLAELRDTWIRCERTKSERNEGAVWNEIGQEERRQSSMGVLEWLINLRNAYAHKKIPRQDLAHAIRGRDVAARAIREYRWLRDYELWISDGNDMALLRGRHGTHEPGGPSELRRTKGVVLRRRSQQARGARRTLELPPLLVSPATISALDAQDAPGASPTALLYGEVQRDSEIQYSAPDSDGVVRPQATRRHLDDLRRRQQAKDFPRLDRSALTYEDLLERTKAATERTLRILEATLKYRRELHVERADYEPRLAAWIDSPVPLLGLAAEAGAGKTGILASLVHRWRESSDKPVLLLLARDFQSMATIDRVLRATLFLGDDVTATDLAETLTGLVVVVDGLNEHPNRVDLLDGIRGLARGGLQTGRGPRFALSWRTEDDAWMQSALGERSLWWTPPSSTAMQQLDEWLGRDESADSGDGGIDSMARHGEDRGMSAKSSRRHRAAAPRGRADRTRSSSDADSEGADRSPFVAITAFTEQEVAEAWDRYRDREQQRMCPRFDWRTLDRECPELSWDLRNPLRMRIAMECYHDRDLPEHLRVEEVFESYLDMLRGGLPGDSVAALLSLLGEMMFESRSTRFDKADLERRDIALVYGGKPLSAFDFLERAGVLSVLDEQGRTAFTFTVERVAEQVLGEHLASLPDAETPAGLARLANDLPGSEFMLGPGAIRVALRLRVAEQGRDFLYDFIDAQPESVGQLAGGALAAVIVSGGESGAASIAEELLADPTDADFEVAERAAIYFYRRSQFAIERAFLEPFVGGEHRARIESSTAAADLAVEYIDCLLSGETHHAADPPSGRDSDLLATIEPILDSLRTLSVNATDSRTIPLRRSLTLVGRWSLKRSNPAVAIERFQEAVAIGRCAPTPDSRTSRRRLAVELEWLGDALREAGRHDEALKAYREAIETGMHPTRCENWSPASVWAEIAKVHEAREAWSAAIEAEAACLEGSLEDDNTGNACRTASRLGDLHAKLGDQEAGVEWQHRAVEIAREGGDRGDITLSLGWLGDALREAGRHDEALKAYREAIETGVHPTWCEEWSPAGVWCEIAEVHKAREAWSEAIEAEAACLEGYLKDGNTGNACRTASRLSDLHAKLGDQEAGVEWQHRAVEIAREGGDRGDIALSLGWLGDALREAGRHDEALEAYREAIDAGMHPTRCEQWSPASVWAKIAKAHKAREAWDEAIEAEAACLEGSLEDDNTGNACYAAARLGDLHAELGDPEAGVEWQHRAVEIAREGGDRRHVALSLGWLGNAFREAGRHDEALTAYREAIETGMHPTRCEQWSAADAWAEIAEVHKAREAWSEAIEAEAACLEGYLKDGNTGNACRAAARLGDLHATLGDPEAGVEWQRRAVEIAREGGDRRHVALSLGWLGDALREAGRLDEALEAFREAIEAGMHPTRCEEWSPADAWAKMAEVHTAREAWSEAIEAEAARLEVHLADGNIRNACRAAARLGTLHAKRGDPEAGIEWRRRAVEIARAGDERGDVVLSLEWLGDALREAGSDDEALKAYRDAIDTGMHPERCEEWSPADAWYEIAEIHKARETWSEAIEAFTLALEDLGRDRTALHRDPNNFVWRSQLAAEVHLKLGDPPAASEVLRACEPFIETLATHSWDGAVDTAAAWWERLAEVRLALGDEAGSRDAAAEGQRLRARLDTMRQ